MTQRSEFKEGWPVLSAAALGVGLGLSPLPFYTIDVMVAPLGEEFGWTRADVYSSLAIYTFGAILMAPLIGILSERFGARKVAIISIVSFSLAMMGLALNTGSKPLYFVLWLLLAIGGAGTLPITFTRPVANWFERKRGLALGIALIATGIFGALAKSFAQFIIDAHSWRHAYVALGLLPLIIALPISILTLRDVSDPQLKDLPAQKLKIPILSVSLVGILALVYCVFQFIWPQMQANGLRLEYIMAFAFMALVLAPPIAMMVLPIGTHAPTPNTVSSAAELPGLTLKEALGTWRFWLLAGCFIPISYALGAIIPSLVPLLGSKGFGISEAVGLATLTGLAVLAGRLIGGYLIDRFWAPGIAFIFMALPSLAFVLLAQGELSANQATLAILMIGFGAGVEYDFMAFLVSKYFGMRRYSAIYGSIYGCFAIGAGFGPSVMNHLADVNGWSNTLLWAGGMLFVATLPLLMLGKYRYGLEHGTGDGPASS